MVIKLYFILILSFLSKGICGIIYTPFDSYKNSLINSIYGTGNQLHDNTYRAYCAVLCSTEKYTDESCCIGNTLSTMKCQTKSECKKIKDYFQSYILKIVFSSYFLLILITCASVSLIFFCLTKDREFKTKNALASFILVFCGALVIPIIVIEIYCCCKGVEVGSIFGADFKKCGGSNLMQSVEIKNEKRKNIVKENEKKNYVVMEEKPENGSSAMEGSNI